MTRQRRILITFAVLYTVMMVYLLFFREPSVTNEPYWELVQAHFNPIPFRTVKLYLRLLENPARPWLVRLAHVNLLGNILLFIPLGLFPPLLHEKMRQYWKVLLLAFGIMVQVELLQMLLLVGTCDVDDLLLNVSGASIGYALFWLTHRKKPK